MASGFTVGALLHPSAATRRSPTRQTSSCTVLLFLQVKCKPFVTLHFECCTFFGFCVSVRPGDAMRSTRTTIYRRITENTTTRLLPPSLKVTENCCCVSRPRRYVLRIQPETFRRRAQMFCGRPDRAFISGVRGVRIYPHIHPDVVGIHGAGRRRKRKAKSFEVRPCS